jgi:hypothetical protein
MGKVGKYIGVDELGTTGALQTAEFFITVTDGAIRRDKHHSTIRAIKNRLITAIFIEITGQTGKF